MGQQLKLRIETAGAPREEIARLLRDVARRIDDGRVHGIIDDRNGQPVGAGNFDERMLRSLATSEEQLS